MKPHGRSDHLDDAQLARLLGAFDLREHEGLRRFAVVLALVKLGVRKSELCDLNREDLSVYNQRLTARILRAKSARGNGPATRRADRLLVDKELDAALQAYWKTLPDGLPELVCHADPQRRGVPVFFTHPAGWHERPARLTARSVDLIIIDGAKSSGLAGEGLRITPHSLRATAATMMLRAGVDIATVAKALGHADVGSVMPYVRAREDDVFAAQETIRPGRRKPK